MPGTAISLVLALWGSAAAGASGTVNTAASPSGPQGCQTTTPPAIPFSFVPPLLSSAAVQGNVAFTANPCIASDYAVALFIHVPGFNSGNYICKPYEDAPLTAIGDDGSWTAEYATGGMDVDATEVWAFLVTPGFTWPCFTDTLPAVDGSSVFAVVSVNRSAQGGLGYYTVTPCRLLDTRSSGQALASGAVRVVQVTGMCGIPANAVAVSLNITEVLASSAGFITLFSGNGTLPRTSTINFGSATVRANNAIVELASDASGTLAAFASLASGQVNVIIDVNGFFR